MKEKGLRGKKSILYIHQLNKQYTKAIESIYSFFKYWNILKANWMVLR